MTKEQKQILKKLKKEKNYEEIFIQFGQEKFVKSVNRKYRKQDISKLKKEGKFEDIYLRYGEITYNSLLHEFKQREIEEVYGRKSIKAISHKIYYKIKSTIALLLYSIGMIGGQQVVTQIGTTIVQSELIKSQNEMQYGDLIKEYEERS